MSTEQQHLGEWQIESVRVTFFLSEALADVEPGLWTRLMGSHPETSTSQPRRGGFREEGPLDSNQLILQSARGRVDLALAPQPREDVLFPLVGQFPEPRKEFDTAVHKLVEIVKGSVQRVAFGLILRLPVASREEGYRSLTSYMHNVRIDPETSSDFLYQINRKRTVPVGDSTYRINRLSKWSVIAVVRTSLSAVEGSAVIGIGVRQASEAVFASSLELDMSTISESEAKISPEHVTILLKTLSEQANEIARNGDIA